MSTVGIGLRQPHYTELIAPESALAVRPGFVEVHAENFFASGGAARAVLHQARHLYDVSLHGVGLGLGSAHGLDAWHLDQLAALVSEIEPQWVSDHACFAQAPLPGRTGITHAADLLPIAWTEASLDLLCANVDRVQQRLRRVILVENISAYLSYADDVLAEPQFFAELCRRSGCQLLLDINNLYVNALNRRVADPLAACQAWIATLPPDCVGEIHLAGYTLPATPESLVIDDHATPVHAPVWQLYAEAVRQLGRVPTLIEWDTEIPSVAVLLDEAARAARIQAQHAAHEPLEPYQQVAR